MVGQPGERGAGQEAVAEGWRPFLQRSILGHGNGPPLTALADDLVVKSFQSRFKHAARVSWRWPRNCRSMSRAGGRSPGASAARTARAGWREPAIAAGQPVQDVRVRSF